MTHNTEEVSVDPPVHFGSVESVAEQIFDRMPHLETEDGATGASNDPNPVSCDEADPRILSFTGANTRDPQSVFVRTEKLLTTLMLAMDDRHPGTLSGGARQADDTGQSSHRSPDPANAPDISYHAANRRAQLPSGIEILHGEPNAGSEEETLSSIRKLMDEQAREQAETRLAEKRAFNQKVLPALEPQDLLDDDLPEDFSDQASPLSRRIVSGLNGIFRNYYFLAISLAGWCTLAMMVLIDPAVGQALGKLSILLLLAAYCMFSEQSQRAPQRWRFGRGRKNMAHIC